MEYDVIIIGNGPAGISAALYIKRANLNVLIISKGEGTLKKVKKIENYYGLEKPLSGAEIEQRGIAQAKSLGIEIVTDEVVGISYNSSFIVETVNSSYKCKKVIIATGSSRKKPNIKGITEFEGKGISYCTICDAFFFKNKNVAVLGSKEYAIHEAEQLKNVTKNVRILTNGEPIIENRSGEFQINATPIREFRGKERLEKIEYEDGTNEKVDGVFIAIGIASSSELAKKVGALVDENNNIIVNKDMQTNVYGLFACGDCTGGTLQIAKCVYEGMQAALSAIKQIKEEKKNGV